MITRSGIWRWFAAICLAALAGLTLCLAYAENELTISAYLTPGDFVGPGQSTLTVLLYNPGEYPARNVSLSPSEKQQGQSIDDIAPGESARFECGINVSQKALDAGGVDVYVFCTLNGQRVKQQLSAPVQQVAALAEAEFSRRASGSVARAGEKLSFTYTLRNSGSVGLENVVIFDSLDNHSFPAFALEPGETWEVTRTVTAEKSAVSRVSASFTSALSGTQYYLYAEELNLSVRGDDVRITPLESGEDALLRLEIANEGQFNYTSLSLSEPLLGRVPFLPAALAAGERFTVDVPLPTAAEDRQYRFQLSLRDESGASAKVYAEPILVAATAARELPAYLTAGIAPNTDLEGDAAFLLTLSGGGRALRNVILGEKTLGPLRTLAVVPAGAETVVYLSCESTSSGEYSFYAAYALDDAEQTLWADPLTASFVSARGEKRGLSVVESLALSALKRVDAHRGVFYAGAAVLAALIAGLVAALIRRRLRKQKKPKGVTSKFVPVHAKSGAKEKE